MTNIEATLGDVDLALDRLRDGSYRVCESCGGEITEALLTAEPLRTTCAAHPRLNN